MVFKEAVKILWRKGTIKFLLAPIFILCSSNSNAQYNTSTIAISDSTLVEMNDLSSKSLVTKGVEFMQLREYYLARSYFDMAVNKATKEDSVTNEILAINNIGILFYYLNETDSALTYYYQALDKAEQSESLFLQNTINNNIGIIYSLTGHHQEAIEITKRALALSLLLQDTLKMAHNLTNLGAQYIIIQDYESAKTNLILAEKYYSTQDNYLGLRKVNTNLGDLNYNDSNYQKALHRFEESLNIARNKLHAIELPNLYYNLGKTHFALKNYNMALSFLDTAYQAAINNNQWNEAAISLNWTTSIYSELQRYDTALFYANLSIALKDSIIQKEKKNWIEESKTKYQFMLKKREYATIKENAERRSFFTSFILLGLLIIIILLIIILRMRMKASQLREKTFQKEKKINQSKLSKATTRNTELEETIDTINYQLVSKTLLIDHKNQILDSIGSLVSEVERNDVQNNMHINQLKHHLQRDNNVDKNWKEFEVYFERVHTHFFQKIHQTYPNLTTNDLRLMAFILLQFNAKEISQILNITPESVRKRKQRLREKLNLNKGSDLLGYIYTYTT
jgi:tetratricopeptide (TPR) repeat protein